ncbi:MAG: glucose-6-phosphate isomerase family protein [Candidatus Daviesbacteria bacterium]|nr:glucose-6-phosphate isomerase family protein [Candidatus Daviesbacteria bacterium]
MITAKTNKDLKPVLMDPTGKKVKNPYYLIVDKEQVIFVVSPGQNGIEFNKTEGYFNTFPGMQTYLCLHGSGILLMQRNDELGAKEFKMVILNPMKKISVPASWAMCLVNTGNGLLVVLRNALDEKYKDSKPLIEKRGLAYYIVEKKGEIAFEQNPNYRVHPQITTE